MRAVLKLLSNVKRKQLKYSISKLCPSTSLYMLHFLVQSYSCISHPLESPQLQLTVQIRDVKNVVKLEPSRQVLKLGEQSILFEVRTLMGSII